MTRKRDGYAANWGEDRVLRQLGEELVDADDAAIEAHRRRVVPHAGA